MNYGIDHIAFYGPHQFLSSDALAEARRVDPLKYKVGIGILEAAVASPAEDVVVLAANAADRVLREAGVSPSEIGLLIVGTESAIDKSKPVATHVHELLGVNPACRVYDIVHACVGATYGVLSAIDWLKDPAHQYALVIASDIARYGKNSLGEPTQGAGAVAMLVSRSPRLLSISEVGTFSKSVYDFWKPVESAYPIVDGIYSAQCYGEAAEACFKGLELSANAAYLYHVPYPKLVQQTHTRITRLMKGNVDVDAHFRDHVASSCVYPARIGNIYTGSLWLALISFFGTYLATGRNPEDLARDFNGCYLFSYGAGCGAELMRGEFSPSWAGQAAHFKFEEYLQSRRSLTIGEYESFIAFHENPSTLTDDVLKSMECSGRFRYLGTKTNKRQYGLNESVLANQRG